MTFYIVDVGSATMSKSLETRSRIFDAAVALVARDGVSAVSVQAILARAGQKNGAAIHYYFGSLDGLWDEIVDAHQPIVERDRVEAVASRRLDESSMRDLVTVVVQTMARCLDSDQGRAYLSIQADRSFRNEWRVGRTSATLELVREEMRSKVDVGHDSFEVRRRMGSRLIWQTFSHLMANDVTEAELQQTLDALVDAVTALAHTDQPHDEMSNRPESRRKT